jgi:multidrug efflux pump subunit AcrA (membrane-fusion protein)
MPRIGMWSISSSRPVVAIHPPQTRRFTRDRPRLSPWLREAWHQLPIAILAIVIIQVGAGCRGDSSAATQPNRAGQEAPAARQVRVTPVAEKALERSTVALGSLAAFDQATISAKVPGRLRSITVDLGSVVQQGQLVAHIDP